MLHTSHLQLLQLLTNLNVEITVEGGKYTHYNNL